MRIEIELDEETLMLLAVVLVVVGSLMVVGMLQELAEVLP